MSEITVGRTQGSDPETFAVLPEDPGQRKYLERRLWEKVQDVGECWEWTGYTRNGYGSFYYRGENLYLHRLSYELYVGPIPDGLHVCHHCDNKPCIRPDHLFAGTPLDNMQDMREKGRERKVCPSGEDNHNATLLDGEVRELRRLVVGGTLNQYEAADRFNVSQSTVWRIVHGHTREEAGGPTI